MSSTEEPQPLDAHNSHFFIHPPQEQKHTDHADHDDDDEPEYDDHSEYGDTASQRSISLSSPSHTRPTFTHEHLAVNTDDAHDTAQEHPLRQARPEHRLSSLTWSAKPAMSSSHTQDCRKSRHATSKVDLRTGIDC